MHKTQLYQWPDKMLFIGPLHEVGAHRHGANAWCLSLGGELGLAPAGGGWSRGRAARIVLGCAHRLHGGGQPVAVLYLHPEYDDWRAAAETTQSAGARLLPDLAVSALLHDAYRCNAPSAETVAELGRLLDRFLYDNRDTQRSPAVSAVVDRLKRHLDRNLPLTELADAARLSPGRLTHRFSAELGLPLRRFRNWHRLVWALELALRGRSLTTAAMDCGFASAAHLSAAFQSTFGLAPSTVLRAPELEFRIAGTAGPGNAPLN